MELRQLRHFVKVAERRNFSDASARAHISQPALSRSIQQLEHDVGATLLRRSPSGVALTPAGERFLQFARMIIAEAERAAAAVSAVHAGAIGEVTLGMGKPYSDRLVAATVLRCRSELPGVVLRIVEAQTEDLLVMLRRGQVDLALSSALPEGVQPGIVVEALAETQDVVIAASSHPLAQSTAPAATELAAARWVLIQASEAQDAHARFFLSHSLPVPRAVRTNSLALIRGLVLQQGFLSILPREVVAADLRAGSMRALRGGPVAPARPAGLMYAERERPRHAAARVAEIVREVCADAPRKRGRP